MAWLRIKGRKVYFSNLFVLSPQTRSYNNVCQDGIYSCFRALHDECSAHWVQADTIILWDGKFKPSTQDVQYACNNTRHLNETAWFLKENSPPAQIYFSRICHSCSVFKNYSTSTQVPNYGIRHLILDTYFLELVTRGLDCHSLHQLSLVQMHQLRQWRYFYRKAVPRLENQDLWQSSSCNILVFFLRNTQIVVIVLNILKRVNKHRKCKPTAALLLDSGCLLIYRDFSFHAVPTKVLHCLISLLIVLFKAKTYSY